MSFTQVYHFQNMNGVEPVISRGNSKMHFMGFNRILLNAGQTITFTVEHEEQAIVLQCGDFTVDVCWKGEKVIDQAKGCRSSVYDELPTAVYVPPTAEVTISSEKGMEARVFTAWCEEGNRPYFCAPENVEEGEPGEYIYKRKYRFIFGAPGKHNDNITRRLIVGESVSVPGGWIGFPAHRHDYVTEKECILDEIFSYQVTSGSPTGEGGLYQHGYDMDADGNKLWDEVNVIETSDTAVALPSGFHTTVSMAGSVTYLLWGLAGATDEKTYRVQFDERYSWLDGCLY